MKVRSNWQELRCAELSDDDLILGMVKAYQESQCDAQHHTVFKDHLPTDECRFFEYVSGPHKGMSDHFNMRQFKEWCEKNRPRVLKRLYSLKVFW